MGLLDDLTKMIIYFRSGSQDDERRRQLLASSYRTRRRRLFEEFEDQRIRKRQRQLQVLSLLNGSQLEQPRHFKSLIPDLSGSIYLSKTNGRRSMW